MWATSVTDADALGRPCCSVLPLRHGAMRTAEFDFALPPELVAQTPSPERGASRLLHVDGGALADLAFTDLPPLLAAGDLVVFNDTRVIKSRLHAAKPTGGARASIAGLTVDQFQRRTSVVEYSRASLKKALKGVQKFAEMEGLDAHGKSAEARIK